MALSKNGIPIKQIVRQTGHSRKLVRQAILTSNRGFAKWGEVFGDPVVATALLDRLLHRAVVIQIEGSSYRLRRHADLMPEHVRSKAAINSPIPAQPTTELGRCLAHCATHHRFEWKDRPVD